VFFITVYICVTFTYVGVNFTLIPAVDGKQLTDEKLVEMNIQTLSGFRDPYHKRPITKGEIGCFMSHYNIWRTVVENKLKMVAVFEDDLRFSRYFHSMLRNLVEDLQERGDGFDWDLIYLGRKRLQDEQDMEPVANGIRYLYTVGYSYWTLGEISLSFCLLYL